MAEVDGEEGQLREGVPAGMSEQANRPQQPIKADVWGDRNLQEIRPVGLGHEGRN